METTYPIERVIDRVGLVGVARALGSISPQAVNKWRRSPLGVPLDRCPSIEAIPGHSETCETLRPDALWVRDETGAVTGYQVNIEDPDVVGSAQHATSNAGEEAVNAA